MHHLLPVLFGPLAQKSFFASMDQHTPTHQSGSIQLWECWKTDTHTDRHTDMSDSITSIADAGDNKHLQSNKYFWPIGDREKAKSMIF